eukprot:scaffold125848_cov63-Phaeocystis_antarctica.AAC.2
MVRYKRREGDASQHAPGQASRRQALPEVELAAKGKYSTPRRSARVSTLVSLPRYSLPTYINMRLKTVF